MRRHLTKHLEAYITPWAQFHAYVLGNLIGIRWGKITPTSGMGNEELGKIVKEYLEYAAGDDEWKKRSILDAMRNRSGATIKDDTRYVFPSLFPRNKRARPFGVPEELENEEVNFDPQRVELWSLRAKLIKQEINMNENAVAQETTEIGDARPPIDRSGTGSGTNSRVTVNFFIPQGVSVADLTLENYREVTGKRFRMTKDQMSRGLSREVAFVESKALVVGKLGDN